MTSKLNPVEDGTHTKGVFFILEKFHQEDQKVSNCMVPSGIEDR
jgi:hypothetical protein